MQFTHLGHACVLVETEHARLLIDPGVFSDVTGVSGVDAVLITHQHPDHIDIAKVASVLAASGDARLVVDPDTAAAVPDLPTHTVASARDRFTFGATTVDVFGGLHAPVFGSVPGCTNSGYSVDEGAFVHAGDSFDLPEGEIDVLAVAIDGPWLKLSEAIDYLHAAGPRVVVPIHEGETTDPAKYAGMLDALSGGGVVQRLTVGAATAL